MEIKSFFKKLIQAADRIMFPQHYTCNICKKEIFDDGDFCKECLQTLKFIDEFYCECCGRRTNIPVKRCYSCDGEWAVDKARSVFEYSGGAEIIIKSIKYGGRKYLAEIMAPYLKKVYVKNFFAPDFITYVPMTEKSQKKRGFNQAELIAKNLAKFTDNRLIGTLIKTKETSAQKGLSAEERRHNLIKCFAVNDKSAVHGKKILLVDDVLTTGATAHACAKVLKKAGAKSVYLITIASVQRDL